ncbi:MAG: phosphate transport system protein [Natronomonas sp.]|jgi:phosphate transport system protein
MARQKYHDRLARLRGNVGAMADLVVERYRLSVDVLESGDSRTAERVIDGDDELNAWYLDIEGDCVELIGQYEALASDLRCIASSFKIVTDLERIGDLSTNLAAYGQESNGSLPERIPITSIASTAGEMVEDAMEAYTKQNADLARAVVERDDELDDACRRASEKIVRELVAASRTAGKPATSADNIDDRIESVTRALLTIRDLERVGDHAVNICARTVYMLENDTELIY